MFAIFDVARMSWPANTNGKEKICIGGVFNDGIDYFNYHLPVTTETFAIFLQINSCNASPIWSNSNSPSYTNNLSQFIYFNIHFLSKFSSKSNVEYLFESSCLDLSNELINLFLLAMKNNSKPQQLAKPPNILNYDVAHYFWQRYLDM